MLTPNAGQGTLAVDPLDGSVWSNRPAGGCDVVGDIPFTTGGDDAS